MNIINQRKFKKNYGSITESSTTNSQANLQLKTHNTRQNRPQLQQYKPLKSQIICIGETRGAVDKNNDVMKKKHYRYLRYDASKDEDNKKSITKSLSKSKTTSTQSLRVHKIRSITRQMDQKNNKVEQQQPKSHPKQAENVQYKLNNQSKSESHHKLSQKGQFICLAQSNFQKLNRNITKINEQFQKRMVSNYLSTYHKILIKNKLIGMKIICKNIQKMLLCSLKDSLAILSCAAKSK